MATRRLRLTGPDCGVTLLTTGKESRSLPDLKRVDADNAAEKKNEVRWFFASRMYVSYFVSCMARW